MTKNSQQAEAAKRRWESESDKKRLKKQRTRAAIAVRQAKKAQEAQETVNAEQMEIIDEGHLKDSATQTDDVNLESRFILSDVIQKIKDDYEREILELKQKLKKIEKSTPRKPVHELSRNKKAERIKAIAALIQSEDQAKPTEQDVDEIFDGVCTYLGICHTAKEQNVQQNELSALEDLKVCSGSMTWYQRRNLKTALIKLNKDILAPDNQVYKLMKEFGSVAAISAENGAYYINNVKEVLEIRLSRLSTSKKIRLGEEFKGKIFLCFSGDKGGSSTKCCISIGNAVNPNSVDNLVLVGIYDGDDKAVDLRQAFSTNLFAQINAIRQLSFQYGEKTLTVDIEWFITGDMKFLCAMYGHLGACATHPCLFCEATSAEYVSATDSTPRSLDSMTIASLYYQSVSHENMKVLDQTNLKRRCKSITKLPALNIPVEQIIPSSLHIVQGLAQDILGILEQEAQTLSSENDHRIEKLEAIYKSLGADKQAWFQKFTGNHLRLLLTSNGPAKMVEVIKESQMASALLRLFQLLGEIQGFAKASFLNDEEIAKFGSLVLEYIKIFRANFSTYSITSKAHWLVVHVPQFMNRWCFWGLMSEQPIEAMHHQMNKDDRRFASMRSRDLIIKKGMEHSCLRNALFDLEISEAMIPDVFSDSTTSTVGDVL